MLNDIPDSEIQPFHELAGNELICELRKTPTVLYGIFTELAKANVASQPVEIKTAPNVKGTSEPLKAVLTDWGILQ